MDHRRPLAPSPPTVEADTGARRLVGLIGVVSGLGVLAFASPAHASVFDVFGMTARGTAMGGAMGATATDHAAIYYNPAAMTRRKKVHVGWTAQLWAPAITIDQVAESTRDAVLPETNLGLTIGAVFPLGGKIDDRVAIGVALFFPVLDFTRYEAIDPATPQLYLYQSLPDALVVAAAVGVEITDWLALGVGTQILASFAGDLDVRLRLADRRVERRTIEGEVLGEIAPTAGITIGPFAGLSFGFTYRDDIDLRFELPVRFDIAELGALDIVAEGSGLYTPDQLNFALAYDFGALTAANLLLAFDLTWMRFSAAPSPALRIEATLDDAGLRQDGDATAAPLLEFETIDPELGAADVLVPRIGAEYRVSDLLALQAGYFFRASPIPDQTGYSNYADAAAHVASLGASLTWNDPLEVHENPVTIDIFVQSSVLPRRTTTKRPSQDLERIGDWAVSGSVWNFGVEARHDF